MCCPDTQICVADGQQCVAELAILPAAPSISPLQTVQFSTPTPVTWEVREGEPGGHIDAQGLYRPPMTAGSYHIVAHDEVAGVSSTVEVVVTPLRLDLVAGQLGGPGDADGIGPDARFHASFKLAADRAGNLIIGDGHLLRKLDRRTGVVSTIARTIYSIGLLAADNDFAYYYLGGSQGPLQRVSLTTGAEATLDVHASLRALTTDGQGHLFLGAYSYPIITQLTVATGAWSLLCGDLDTPGQTDGACDVARFQTFKSVAYDPAGALWVIEGDQLGGHTSVRRVDLAARTVATLANSPPIASQIGVEGGNLFVADAYGGVTIGTPVASAAGFDLTGRIQLHDRTGGGAFVVVNNPHPNSVGYSMYTGVNSTIQAFYELGTNLIVAGRPPSVGVLDGTGNNATFSQPRSIIALDRGRFLIPYARELSMPEARVTASTCCAVTDAAQLGGRLYASNRVTSESIVAIDPSDGTRTLVAGGDDSGQVDGVGPAARFNDPVVLSANTAGQLLVAQGAYRTYLRRVDVATGEVVTWTASGFRALDAGSTGEALSFPFVFDAVTAADSLFVAVQDGAGGTVERFDLATGARTQLVTLASFPSAMVFGPGGWLYISAGSNVRRVDPNTGTVEVVVGSDRAGVRLGPAPAGLNQPAGMVFTEDGGLLVAEAGENSILLVH